MGRTILVADDSPTVQKKASGILTGEGLDVVTVSNGVAAVKKLPTVNPLVVLADVAMPGKDGYEVCEHIKSTGGLSHVSVVLIFSDTDPYEDAKGARVGADGRIKKPFDRDELVAMVAKFVAQAEAAVQKAAAPPKPPPLAFEVEPTDAEPEVPVREEAPDLSGFSGGMAFGMPGVEEVPSVPIETMPAEPLPVEPVSPELMVASDAGLDAIAESAQAVVEPEPALVTEPQAMGAVPEAAEPLLVEEEAAPLPTSEPSPGETVMFRAPADIAQPIFSDELEAPAAVAENAPVTEPPPAVEAAPEPEPQAEVEAAPAEMAPAPEAEVRGVETPPGVGSADITPPEGTPVAPRTLESYTLGEAAAGHVKFAPPRPEAATVEPAPAAPPTETVAPPAPVAAQPEAAQPAEPPTPPPATGTMDAGQIFTIVHRVVVKMSPPALSAQMIEDIARKFSDEIAAELNSES